MWLDPSSNMAYGNQWMNPAHYKNMTNEQVDWASLAQQWIKMKETPVMPPGPQGRTMTNETNLIGTCQPIIESKNPSHLSVQNKTLGDHSIASSITGNTVEKPSAWNTWTWQQQQQWNWNWASSSAPPIKTTTIDPVNPIRPPYVTPPLLTEPPPSFPMIPPNKQFPSNNYWAGPNTRIPPPIETDQWSKTNLHPNVDDRVQDTSFIDAAKRKTLPAWIREGLEKMERKKRQQIELEQSFEKNDYSSFNNEIVSQELRNSPNSFDHETQMFDDEIEHINSPEYINDTEPRKTELIKKDSSLLIPRKTKAQIWEDTMLNLRHVLTKLLMEVTNDMMLSVAKDVIKTTNLQTDIQGNQSKTSLAGKLGLGVYGSPSESSDDNDEEQLSGHKESLGQESDEAIQERLMKRQREFINIEAKILIELDQLEEREKHVRSTFDNSVKLSGDTNDSRQVVENIHSKGRIEDEGSSQKIEKVYDKTKKDLSNDSSNKNGQKKKKSKSKRSSSSSISSSSSESKKSDDSDSKYRYKKNEKMKSKSSNKRSKTDSVKRKRRSRSKNRSRSHSRSKHSRSRSRHRSNSRSRHYDRRSPHSYRSRRSRSPISRYGSSRKYKNKRNSSSSSNESRSTKHRYRR